MTETQLPLLERRVEAIFVRLLKTPSVLILSLALALILVFSPFSDSLVSAELMPGELWSNSLTGTKVLSLSAIPDINSDGHEDVFAVTSTSSNGTLYLLDGRTGSIIRSSVLGFVPLEALFIPNPNMLIAVAFSGGVRIYNQNLNNLPPNFSTYSAPTRLMTFTGEEIMFYYGTVATPRNWTLDCYSLVTASLRWKWNLTSISADVRTLKDALVLNNNSLLTIWTTDKSGPNDLWCSTILNNSGSVVSNVTSFGVSPSSINGELLLNYYNNTHFLYSQQVGSTARYLRLSTIAGNTESPAWTTPIRNLEGNNGFPSVDANKDNVTDVLAILGVGSNLTLINGQNGTILNTLGVSSSKVTSVVAAGDVNGDGIKEVAVRTDKLHLISLEASTYSIVWEQDFGSEGIDSIEDVDGDGYKDIVAATGAVVNALTGSPIGKVATPTFSPSGGTYNATKNVTISCATVGATIRYTTNGTEPASTSVVYSAPILVNTNMTVKAKAFKPGLYDSDTENATYTILLPKVATPTFSPIQGIYNATQNVTISCVTVGATIRYTTNGSEPNPTSTLYTSPISVNANLTIKAKAFATEMTDSNTSTATYTVILPRVATPTFNPVAGTYNATKNVAIQCQTVDATLRYTVDGSDPSLTSTEYLNPVLVNTNTTVKAKAFASGMAESYTANATYTIIIPQVVTPTFNPGAGSYSSAQNIAVQCATVGATIRYTTNGTEPTSTSAIYSTPVPVNTNTTLKAKAFATGMIDSNTATSFYIITKVATPTFSPAGGSYSSTLYVTIQCATPGTVIRYTTNGSEPSTSSPSYSSPIILSSTATVKAKGFLAGLTDSNTGSATYAISIPVPQVATPTFNPIGATYSATQNVAIQCQTVSATIHYTTDGSEPTSTSTLYASPILVNVNMTIKAKAFALGMTDSLTGLATYVLILTPPKVATPSFNPAGGSYSSVQDVSIQCATASATIRYTTDGSEPTSSSLPYFGSILVGSDTTIRAKAFRAGMEDSEIATAVYIITKVATPTFDLSSGSFYSTQDVAVRCDTVGATIRYTTNGSDPSSSSTTYTSPILVDTNMTVKARAFKTGMLASDIASETYTIYLPPPKIATPTFSPAEGSYSSILNVTIQCATSGVTIRYTTTGFSPSSSSPIYSNPILVSSSTVIRAKAFKDGWTDSDTASATYVLDVPTPKVAPPSFSPVAGAYNATQNVTIQCATAGATIRFTTDDSNPVASSPVYSGALSLNANLTIKAKAFMAGMIESDTASATYTIVIDTEETKVIAPTFSPQGGTYPSPQPVTLNSETPNATICYTDDGSEPSSTSKLYSAPIFLSETTTIKAKAFAAGMIDSDTATAIYTISPPQKIATPTFSPAEGSYSSGVTVTIQCATAGAVIRYTTTGLLPSTSSPIYSGPILINTTITITAMAFNTEMIDSNASSATYTIIAADDSAQEPFLGGDLLYIAIATIAAVIIIASGILYLRKRERSPVRFTPID